MRSQAATQLSTGPGPQHGMTLDEQDVAGEDGAVLRHVDQYVAPRMRRPDILEAARSLSADLELQASSSNTRVGGACS